MSLYIAAQDSAYRMLSENGLTVTLKRTTDTYDPVAGEDSDSVVETFTTVGVLADLGFKDQGGESIVETTKKMTVASVRTSLKKLTMAAKDLGTVPELTDTVVFDNVEYSINNIEEVKPASIALIYKLQLSR